MFVIAWGGNEFTPLLIFYRGESVFSPVFVDSLLGAYAIGIMAGLVFLGPLSDRYGRKTVMLWGPVAAIIGSILIAVGEKSEIPTARPTSRRPGRGDCHDCWRLVGERAFSGAV